MTEMRSLNFHDEFIYSSKTVKLVNLIDFKGLALRRAIGIILFAHPKYISCFITFTQEQHLIYDESFWQCFVRVYS